MNLFIRTNPLPSLFLLVLTSFTFHSRIQAQAIKSLSPQSQLVLDRLAKLRSLPVPDWRFHAGDIAHAESVLFDDSAWTVVQGHSHAPNEAVWYRRWIEVPSNLEGYDLSGARIWFHFAADANGPMPEVIYFNGRRVAQGDDLEPVVLLDQAKPGEKVLVAVKLLHTVDRKYFDSALLRIETAPARPNPGDLRTQLMSAALLVPSLSRNAAAGTKALEGAINAVDLKALDSGNQAAFDASLKAAQSKLLALDPEFRQLSVDEDGNSHIDAAWLWPWTETVDVVKRTFGTALQLMNEYPAYTYTQSAAAYNAWMAEKYPALDDEIKARISEGRWELVGGMWVEPDLNMPDGESLVRQLLVGKRFYQQHYGVDVRIGWNPDSFGYNWQLPQIYKKCGVDYFVTQKMAWNDTNKLPLKLFWWQSPDGSRVLTYFPHDYANDNLDPVRLSADLAQARRLAPGMNRMLDLYGIGDHGGGPTRPVLDQGIHWQQPGTVVPRMMFATAQAFFSSIQGSIDESSPEWNYHSIAQGKTELPVQSSGKVSIPTWNDELYLEYHRGVFTSQANHKWNMRHSEEWLLDAEKYASLAWLEGRAYPNSELNEAWQKTLFNQFHDLAAGSGIGAIYKDAQRDYDQVRWATGEVSTKAWQAISSEVDTEVAGAVPILVFNSLPWRRSGVAELDIQMPGNSAGFLTVLDSKGHAVPMQILSGNRQTNTYHVLLGVRDLPSLGYEVLHAVTGKRDFPSALRVDGLMLENAALRVRVNSRTGCIESLYDKRSNFETLVAGSCGNELVAFKDTPKDYDAWNIDAGFDKTFTTLDAADSVQLVEQGPLRAVIRVVRTWRQSKFVQDIILYSGSDEVEIANSIDWHETHTLLKAAFTLNASSGMATYEIPYGTIARPTTRNNTWESAKFEVPALRWTDLGDQAHGFSLINESKYGYDAKGNVLRLSLLRSPTWPDPVADQGRHHFSYALYPHSGGWQQALTVRRGYEFNYKLRAMQVLPHKGVLPPAYSFVSVEPENVVLTAAKKAEDSDALILHLYEWAGRASELQIEVPPGATSARITNLLEQAQGNPLRITGHQITAPIHPYEILSIRIDYPHPAN